MNEATTSEPNRQSATELEVTSLVENLDRNGLIKALKTALQRRSGKQWSVTGGRGTAWGWITVDAPPARRTWSHRLRAGATTTNPSDYEAYDSGEPNHGMSPTDQAELATLLGLDKNQCYQGVSIPTSSAYRRVYLHRALYGNAGSFTAEPYWD